MRPADIDSKNRTIVARRLFTAKSVHWDSIEKVILCALPSLVDELGVVVATPVGEFFLRETQTGYGDLFAALELESELPDGWYVRAEQGEQFVIELR